MHEVYGTFHQRIPQGGVGPARESDSTPSVEPGRTSSPAVADDRGLACGPLRRLHARQQVRAGECLAPMRKDLAKPAGPLPAFPELDLFQPVAPVRECARAAHCNRRRARGGGEFRLALPACVPEMRVLTPSRAMRAIQFEREHVEFPCGIQDCRPPDECRGASAEREGDG